MTPERHVDTIEIDISTPSRPGARAIIDRADLPVVEKWKWRINGRGYVIGTMFDHGRRSDFYLHRVIALPPPGMQVDHENGDKLDNRRSNLRVCTALQNAANKRKLGKLKGVKKARRRWEAVVTQDGIHHRLGYFEGVVDAAIAYDLGAHRLFGQFARPNFPCALLGEPMILADPKPVRR